MCTQFLFCALNKTPAVILSNTAGMDATKDPPETFSNDTIYVRH